MGFFIGKLIINQLISNKIQKSDQYKNLGACILKYFYSYRNDSTGSNFAALFAGIIPDNKATTIQRTSPNTIPQPWDNKRRYQLVLILHYQLIFLQLFQARLQSVQ